LCASTAEDGGVGDEYASRRPDSAKVGLEVCEMGRTWRRGNSRDVDENTWRAGEGCEVATMMKLFDAWTDVAWGTVRRWMIFREAGE